jgi:hypothetical protein
VLDATLGANGTHWSRDSTTLIDTVNLWDDPDFAYLGGGAHHFEAGSAAISAGVEAGKATEEPALAKVAPQRT